MKLRLPIYFETDATQAAKLCGKDTLPFSEYEVRYSTFYTIDCVLLYIDDDETEHSEIYSGGCRFQSPLKPKEVERLIDEAKLQQPCPNNNTRLQALELASKLRSSDGEAMTLKELTGKAEEILEWINKP